MIKKSKIKQIKTYKDIIENEIGNEFDVEGVVDREKFYLKMKKDQKEKIVLLLKVFTFFIVILISYLLILRYYTKKNEIKEPLYFSNYFHNKIIAENEETAYIKNIDIKNINIEFLKKLFNDSHDNINFFNILYVYSDDQEEVKNFSLKKMMIATKKGFVEKDIDSFGNYFAIGKMNSVKKETSSYFAFFEVKNFSLANKYLKEWESRIFINDNKNGIEYGFLSKNMMNNKVRVALNKKGDFYFGYSFLNKNILVFFDNEKSFIELVKNNIVVR